MSDASCKCCGIPIDPADPRAEWRRCAVCDRCDRRHGDELQIHIWALLNAGQISRGHAFARMLIDDALLTGNLELRPEHDEHGNELQTATLWITRPPRRWEVVVGRACARNEVPEVGLVVEVTLARYIPGPASPENMQGLADELTTAFCFMDDNVLSVDVSTERVILDPQHLIIRINTKTAAAPGMITTFGADAELPDDIMQRPRGQA